MILGICNYCKREFRKREQKYKFCSLHCSNNFNKNGFKDVPLPEPSNDLAEFVGICLGDGCVTKYQVSITLNTIADSSYIPYVINLSKKLFPKITISLVRKGKFKAVDIRLNSSKVSKFLYDMGLVPHHKKVPHWIQSKLSYKKACVKGLFDTEGSSSQKRYQAKSGSKIYYQLNFRNYDKTVMRFVRDLLLEIDLKPTITLTRSLYISNLKDVNTYLKMVGSGNPKILNRFTSMRRRQDLNLRELV